MRRFFLLAIITIFSFFSANVSHSLSKMPELESESIETLFELSFVSPMFSWIYPKAEVALYSNNELLIREDDQSVTRYTLSDEAKESFVAEIHSIVSKKEWGFIPVFDAAQGVFKFNQGGLTDEFYVYAPYALVYEENEQNSEGAKNRLALRTWFDKIHNLNKITPKGFKKERSVTLSWEMRSYSFEPWGEYSPKVKKWPFLTSPKDNFCIMLSPSDSRRAVRLIKNNELDGSVFKKSYGKDNGIYSIYLSAVFPHQIACSDRGLVI